MPRHRGAVKLAGALGLTILERVGKHRSLLRNQVSAWRDCPRALAYIGEESSSIEVGEIAAVQRWNRQLSVADGRLKQRLQLSRNHSARTQSPARLVLEGIQVAPGISRER